MRAVTWAISAGVWVCAACGKTADDGFPPGQGGASTAGGASSQAGAHRGGSETGVGGDVIAGGSSRGGGAPAGAGSGGATMTLGGSTSGGVSHGGASGGGASGGGAMNSGGTAGLGGGEAGTSGAGAAGACGEFLACGCGCCAGSTTQVRCSYVDVPLDRDGLVAADQAASQSPSCPSTGCSTGSRYLCCKAPPPDPSPATYSASLIVGGLDRIQIVKMGTEWCPRLTFTDGTSRVRTALDGLPRWHLEIGSYINCLMSSVPQNVIGASGSIKARASGSSCVLDMHFAVYALVNEELIPFRFDADGVPVSGASSAQCLGL